MVFLNVCSPLFPPQLIVHPIGYSLYFGTVTGCGALRRITLTFCQLCRAPFIIPFMSTSDGFLRHPLFFQPQCFPHRLSKISSFSPGLFRHGNSQPPARLCFSRALRFSSHLPQCYVVFPVMMAGINMCQGRRAEGRK